MVDRQVSMVVKIEYEIENNREKIWSAYIMAYSQDEAVRYLAKFLQRTIKVSSVGIVAPRVDGLSDEVRSSILGKTTKKAKNKNKNKNKMEDKKADVEPSLEDLEKLQNAREKALKDLEKQGVDVYKEKVKKETKPQKPIKINVKK